MGKSAAPGSVRGHGSAPCFISAGCLGTSRAGTEEAGLPYHRYPVAAPGDRRLRRRVGTAAVLPVHRGSSSRSTRLSASSSDWSWDSRNARKAPFIRVSVHCDRPDFVCGGDPAHHRCAVDAGSNVLPISRQCQGNVIRQGSPRRRADREKQNAGVPIVSGASAGHPGPDGNRRTHRCRRSPRSPEAPVQSGRRA